MQISFSRSVIKYVPLALLGSLGLGQSMAQVQPVGLQQQIPPGEYMSLVDVHNSLNPDGVIPGWLNPEAGQWPGVFVSGFNADENGNVLSVGFVTGIMLPNMNLRGMIPSSLSGFERLEAIDFSNNQLTGKISESLGGHLSLRNLLLSSNKLTGSIPIELGNLPELGFLDLSHNQLSGVVPEALGALQRLAELELQYNNLSGELPAALATMGSLGYINLEGNYFPTNAPSGNGDYVQQLITSGDTVLFHPQKAPTKIQFTYNANLSQLTLSYPGANGQAFKYESSSDFWTWETVQEVPAGTQTPVTVQVDGNIRFYRVR